MNFKGYKMKKLLVDLSCYPIVYFPQLFKKIEILEEIQSPGEFEPVYSPYDSFSYFSFPDEELYCYDSCGDLLNAFCKKLGYDYFEIVS